MVVPRRHSVKAARAIAKLYLSDMARLFQITQRIVNGRKAYARQEPLRRRKNVVGREMIVGVTNDRQNDLALPRQTQILNFLHKTLEPRSAVSVGASYVKN